MHPSIKCSGRSGRRRPVVVAVPAVLAGVVLACSTPDTTPGPPAPSPAASPAPATSAPPEGVLRVTAFPVTQTDPSMVSSDSEVLLASHVYDYLVDVDADNRIQPRLARSWSVSEDGLTYTFDLAENATFADGTPFGADDVVWTFDRLRDPGAGLPTSDLYRAIADIEATGELQVTFTLSETSPFLLYDLADNHALVLKAGTPDPASDFNGTGPFRVTTFTAGEGAVLEANPAYFEAGTPRLAGIEIDFYEDQAQAADAVRSGQADLCMDLSTEQFESLREVPGITGHDIATNQFAAVRLRTDTPPGDDPRVILALRLAVDREAIFDRVQSGYGAPGRDSPIGPIYDEYYSDDPPLPARDVEGARRLLAEAGYEDGLDLELNVLQALSFPALAEVLREQWAEAGIRVRVVPLPESEYYGSERWLDVALGITGWGHRPYPQFYLDVMLRCGARWNESRFCDPELDRLAAIAGTTLDEQERVAAYRDVQRILVERGPLIIPYFFAEYAAVRDEFAGFVLKPFSGRSDLRTVELAADEAAEGGRRDAPRAHRVAPRGHGVVPAVAAARSPAGR